MPPGSGWMRRALARSLLLVAHRVYEELRPPRCETQTPSQPLYRLHEDVLRLVIG